MTTQTRDDEIDLFELLQCIWNARWIITCFTVAGLAFGLAVQKFKPANYETNASLLLNYGSVSNYQLCEAYGSRRSECLMSAEQDNLDIQLSENFTSRDATKKWKASIEKAISERSNEIFNLAKIEREMILSLPVAIQSTERASTNLIQAERIIAQANQDKPFAIITSIKVRHRSYTFIPVLGAIVGFMLSIFYTLIKNAYQGYLLRKEQ